MQVETHMYKSCIAHSLRVNKAAFQLLYMHPRFGVSLVPFSQTALAYMLWLLHLQAVELLSRQADTPVREKDFIKAVPDMDMINAFVGTVKLSMPGLVKIKQDVRKNKKKK